MATGKESNTGNRFIEDSSVIRQNPETARIYPNPSCISTVPSNSTAVLSNPLFTKSNSPAPGVTQSNISSALSSSPRSQNSSNKIPLSCNVKSNTKIETGKQKHFNIATASSGIVIPSHQVEERGSKVLASTHQKKFSTTNLLPVASPNTTAFSSDKLNIFSQKNNKALDGSKVVPVSAAYITELPSKKVATNLQQSVDTSGSKVVSACYSSGLAVNGKQGQKVPEKVISSSLFGVVSKQSTNGKTVSNVGKTSNVSSVTSDYKTAHPIGSRKVTENIITYHEPMFQSVANTLFENQKNLIMGKRKAEDDKGKGESGSPDCKKSKLEVTPSPSKSLDSKSTVVKKKSIENIIERIRTEKTLSRGGSSPMLKEDEEETIKCNADIKQSDSEEVESNIDHEVNTFEGYIETCESIVNKSLLKVDKQTSSQKCDIDRKSENDMHSKDSTKGEIESIAADKTENMEHTPTKPIVRRKLESSPKLKKLECSPPKLKKEKSVLKLKPIERSPSKSEKTDSPVPMKKKTENKSTKEKTTDSTSPVKVSDSSNEQKTKSESSTPKVKKMKSVSESNIKKEACPNIVEGYEKGMVILNQNKYDNNTDITDKKLEKKTIVKRKYKKASNKTEDQSQEDSVNGIKKTIGEKVKVKRKRQMEDDQQTEEPKKKGRKKKDETKKCIKHSKGEKVTEQAKDITKKQSAIKTKSQLKTKVTKQRKQKLPTVCRRVKREASLNAAMFLNILNEKSPRLSKLDSQRSKSDSDIKNVQHLSINSSHSLTNIALYENDINNDLKHDFNSVGLKRKKEKTSPTKQSSHKKILIQKQLLTPKREPKSPTKTPSPKRKVSFSDDVFEDLFEAVIQRSIEATKKCPTLDKKIKVRKKNKGKEDDDMKEKKLKGLKQKNKKSILKTKPERKEKKFRLKKIKQAIKLTASKSPEEVAERKRKANLARLERARELIKTKRKVSEKNSVGEKDSDDSLSVTSEKEDSESVDQVDSESSKAEEVKKVKAKKGALCRAARTHVSVESKTVVENTMPSPRWCECCQSSYYPYQPTQGTQVWRIKHLVDKDTAKSPEPIQSSSNHFIAAHARCEVRPYASPSHVSVIDSNTYVGQIMPHGHIQCSACSCGHSGVFHPGQCQNCTLGGVSNMLPCQRYGGTYSVPYPHTHGSYTHCGCGACYPAGSYHHPVGQTLIHQPQMSMSAESPILLHHPVQLQVTHETSHPVTLPPIPHSHTDSCLTHSTVQPMPLQLSQNEHNLDNLTHMCQLSQGEVTNVSAMASSSPSDHEIDVGSRDDIVKSVPNVSQSSTSISLKQADKILKAVKVRKICTKEPVVKLKRSKSYDVSVKGTLKVKETVPASTDLKVKLKDKKKSNLLLIKEKQKQLEQKSVKFSKKKERKNSSVQSDSSSNSKKIKSAETKIAKKVKMNRSISSEQKKEELKEQTKRAWHGWSWEGEGVTKKVTNIFDGQIVQRKCYNAIRHDDGDIIQVMDCVLVCSGQKEIDIPYVAKVSNFWEDPASGEMMMTVLWFYRPEHAEGGPIFGSLENEVFAAKHRDETLVACIEDRGYVLTYNEYCRFMAEVERTKSDLPVRKKVVPEPEESYPSNRIPPVDINPENVFLCRQVYDIKLKRVLKNPS